LWLPGARGFARWFPGCVRGSAEWSHIHPFGRPRGGHDRAIRGPGLLSQIFERAVARLRVFFELARSLATSSWSVTASPPGARMLRRVVWLRHGRRR
jgi:hypothetical protein